jgi:CMP-2-keto-3-deoxyoctulosonic acid synthetase
MNIVGIIPARYSSSRLPGKPLVDICGQPMIWWVYHQVKKVGGLNDVYVATDDYSILEICRAHGIQCLMTSDKHPNSTSRVHEIAVSVKADLYLCVNGDEPLIEPAAIEKVMSEIEDGFFAANLMTEIKNPIEVVDPSNIKVVTDVRGNAVFMSRSPVPYPKSSLDYVYYKHVGVLLYSKQALDFFVNTPPGKNELIEDINELRFIEHGYALKMIEVNQPSLSVDTPKDLELVRKEVEKRLKAGRI